MEKRTRGDGGRLGGGGGERQKVPERTGATSTTSVHEGSGWGAWRLKKEMGWSRRWYQEGAVVHGVPKGKMCSDPRPANRKKDKNQGEAASKAWGPETEDMGARKERNSSL